MVRSNFQINIVFLVQNFLRIPNMSFVFFCTMRETSKNRKPKITSSIYRYILQILFSYGMLVLFVVIDF